MTASLKASTYLVDGTDLEATDVQLTHDGAGLWAGLTQDVIVETSPGVDGGAIVGGLYRPYQHSTMFLIRGTGFDDVWTKIRALRDRCKPGRTVTLSREMPDPEGTSANVDLTATARRQDDRVDWLGSDGSAAAVDIDWLITSGPWLGAAVAIASAAGTTTVRGDTPTQKMTVTLAAGAARTVTNTTNGYWFTYSGSVPSNIAIDVVARTATVVSSGLDVSAYLSWGKAAPMQLEPGSNTLTVSSGSASISYQPAYL